MAETIVSVLTLLYEHCEKVKTMRDVCESLRNLIGFFLPLLRAYLDELRGRPAPQWVPALESAVREALDAVRTCASNPVKSGVVWTC